MESSLISIIIPVYNVEHYLDRCIQSVVEQTYRNLEIILVDDGSTDNCPKICDEWAKKDQLVRVIHKENGGLSDARNAGLRIANGKMIGFIDADDWIAPEMYDRLVSAMLQDQSDMAACTVKMIWEGNEHPDQFLTVKENRILDRTEAQLALLNETLLKQPVWYKLYKKDLVQDIPFEVGRQHEDVFWSYQVIGKADQISLIDYEGYFYWQRKGSIMGEGYSLKRLDAMEAYCKRYEYFKKEFPSLVNKGLTAIWESCIYNGQMALKYLTKEDQKKAYSVLDHIKKCYPIRHENYANMKISHKLWLDLSRISLRAVALLKNFLRVGW